MTFWIPLVALALTILGLLWKVSSFSTKMELHMMEQRVHYKVLRRLPHLEYRVSTVEKHLDISAPRYINGEDHSEDD